MGDEHEHPLAGLAAAELALTIERLRGEVGREFARIDGEISASQRALEIAEKEIARRLVDLNHAHAEARAVLGTYVTRDVYERDKKEGENRLRMLEDAASNLQGRLWLPMLVVAGIAAGLAAAAVALLTPSGR